MSSKVDKVEVAERTKIRMKTTTGGEQTDNIYEDRIRCGLVFYPGVLYTASNDDDMKER